MNLGAGGLGRMIRRDMAKLTQGGQLNSAKVWVFWHAAVHTFTHEQQTPASAWQVYHGMGERPMLGVISSSGEVISARVEHLSLREARVSFAEATAGTLVCLRPTHCHTQDVAATTWTIPHNLGETPIVQVVVAGEIVSAAISWPDDSTVQVAFSEVSSGYALLAPPTHSFVQNSPANPWNVVHNLGQRPLIQIIDAAGEGTIGQIVHESENAFSFAAAEPVSGRALAVHIGSESDASFNPNVEASYPSTTLQSGCWPGFVHFSQPKATGYQVFAEFEQGDCIVDFVHNVPLPDAGYFEIDGRRYAQKKVGQKLAASWELVIGGQRMIRTALLTLKK